MASVSEQLTGIVAQSAEQMPSAIQSGAQLAQGIEQIQQQRQQIEMKKQDLQMQKIDKLTSAMEAGAKMKSKSARNAFFKNYIPQMQAALGLKDFIPEATMAMIQADPEQARKFTLLRSEIANGKSLNEVISKLDPEEWAMLDEAEVEQLYAAEKFALSEEGKAARAKLTALTGATKEANKPVLAGQQELARKVAQSYADYTTAGGKAGMDAALTNLQEAANALKSGQVVTGGVSTKLPGFKSDDAQSMLNPKLVEVKSQAQGALNSVLRATLGAQFTEKEGERVLNQIWDDRQLPQVNAKKIESKIKELKSNIKNAEAEFQRFGYMVAQSPAIGSDKKIADYASQHGLSYEQALKILEKRGYKPGGK